MKSSLTAIFFFIISIVSMHVMFSQDKPNFSGDWALNLEKSKLQAYWTSDVTYGKFIINHEEPSFSLWRTFTIKGKEKIMAYQIQTDGQEKKGKHSTFWTMNWEQDTLVLVIMRKETVIDSVRYYMSADQKEFVADEKVETPKLRYHNLWVSDRISDN